MPNNILSIIVTYSDRFNLVRKVIDSCIDNGVDKILIVDNNSTENSKAELKRLQDESSIVDVIWNKINYGSSQAFSQALKYAYNHHDGFILLLDDDNKLEENALHELKKYWNQKDKNTQCLLAYRLNRLLYKKAIDLDDPEYVLSPINSFYGFDFFKKIKQVFVKPRKALVSKKVGKIAYAPYGGMFFHKSLLKKIGYPKEDFFLYSDDHEWSYRIYKQGFAIELVTSSKIEDIDQSWAISRNNIFKTIKSASTQRIYYTIRNRVFFEVRERVNNKLHHNINILIFNMLLFFYCFNNKQYRVFRLALKDGLNNNLGKKEDDYFNV